MSPAIHILAGEKVCIQVIRPMQFGALLASWQSLVDRVGRRQHRLEDDLDRHAGRLRQPVGDRLRVGGDLLQHFFAVQVLAAGDEPDFELFEVDHAQIRSVVRIGQ